MSSGLLLGVSVIAGCLCLVCCRRWAYVCICALVEVVWVCIAYLFSITAVQMNEVTPLFWAMAGLFFSAIELCLGLFLFIFLADLRGMAAEVV